MALPAYETENIFAKILREEIPCEKIYEDTYAFAFKDIAPQRPTHILVLPKGAYVSLEDFTENASDAELAGWLRAIGKVARLTQTTRAAGGNGFRLICNAGPEANQEVPHLHAHFLAGQSEKKSNDFM